MNIREKMSMPIFEKYMSRQGEGTRMGLKTLFIRVAGCNLTELYSSPCTYCDSDYAQYSIQGDAMELEDLKEEIMMTCAKNNASEVCITGGEPLFYSDFIYELAHKARVPNYDLVVETNGTLPIWRDDKIIWSMDMKCPSSGNHIYNKYDNLALLDKHDQVKFVVDTKEDLHFAARTIDNNVCFANIVVQPVWKSKLTMRWLWENFSTKSVHNRIRILPQLHKIVYPKVKRGI